MSNETLWQFKTRNFTIQWRVSPCSVLDLSWDETGEVREKLESGVYTAFDSEMRVLHNGIEIAADYLGQSIYENPEDFRDHIGLAKKSREDGRNYGSYFADMVREAIREARTHLRDTKALRVRDEKAQAA